MKNRAIAMAAMAEAMNAILHTQVASRSEGMSPDLVWQIEKFVASKESEGKV